MIRNCALGPSMPLKAAACCISRAVSRGAHAVFGAIHSWSIIQEVSLQDTDSFKEQNIRQGSITHQVCGWRQTALDSRQDLLEVHLPGFEEAAQQWKQRCITSAAGTMRCRKLH